MNKPNSRTNQYRPMTQCAKGGIKIRENNNGYKADPFAGLDPFSDKKNDIVHSNIQYNNEGYDKIDLNIENYSRGDLYKLFGLQSSQLDENVMRECKKTVLKTHPDKSKLDPKFFLFFSKAYKRLYSIYEFQNKTVKKVADTNEYFEASNVDILNKVFDSNADKDNDLKTPKNFNKWFNDQFDKHKLEDPIETGYGDWLKSDEDIQFTPNVTKANMAAEMEKRKKQVQALTTYNGVNDPYASIFGGSSLMEYNSNFTSGSLFSNDGMGYTDLRQAYVESVIPVTEDDFNKVQKFKNMDDYKRHRENIDVKPLDKEEAMRQLYHQNKQKDEESAALAYYYAQQEEKNKKNQDQFWSGLKQITNW